MPHITGLRRTYKLLFASAALASLYSDYVPEGQTWVLRRYAFEGDLATSGGNTRARVYIEGHGYKHFLAEQDAPAADTLYWDTDRLELYERERLVLEWDQAQASTTLQLHLTGYFLLTVPPLAGGP